jgi:hypothetical protein
MSEHVVDRRGAIAREASPSDGTFRVLEENLPALQAEIGRLGRRAELLGTARLALRDSGRREGRHAVVVLEGEPPALLGWTLAAIVDHRDHLPAIRVLGAVVPPLERRRFGEPRCDHCHLRRNRAETFVLWHAASGRVRQVGSGCLRDFLDGHNPGRLCRQAESRLLAQQALARAASSATGVAPNAEGISLEQFAAYAAMAVRANGWVSREQARRSSRVASADAALQSLEAAPDVPRASDLALAEAAVRWARELLGSQLRLSTFERDAVAVVNGPMVLTRRERGLVCALIAVYRRRRLRSRHLGEVGGWLDAVVLVERVIEQPSAQRGAVTRHDLIDVDGNRLVWWQTHGEPLPVGQALHVRGHVARHTHFGRVAITVLAHCELLDRRRPTRDGRGDGSAPLAWRP